MTDRTFQVLFASRPPVRRTAPTWYLAREAAVAEFGSEVVDVVMIPDALLEAERKEAAE